MSGKESSSGLEYKLHPLVLINISDHHTRTRANSGGASGAPSTSAAAGAGGGSSSSSGGSGGMLKVLGILLGSQSGRVVDINNSFEMLYKVVDGQLVIDDAFLLHKQELYKTVFPKQDVVGWYATGASIDAATDMLIHKKVQTINESPVFMLLNPKVDHSRKDLPVSLHETELHAVDGTPTFIFVDAKYSMETSDAERVAVDQVAKIMPSGKASGSEQLTAHLVGIHSALKMLTERIRIIQNMLGQVQSGAVPFQHELLRNVSSLLHSLPAMDTAAFNKDYDTEFNDTLLTLHLAGVTKGVSALNEVVDKATLAYERPGRGRRGGGF